MLTGRGGKRAAVVLGAVAAASSAAVEDEASDESSSASSSSSSAGKKNKKGNKSKSKKAKKSKSKKDKKKEQAQKVLEMESAKRAKVEQRIQEKAAKNTGTLAKSAQTKLLAAKVKMESVLCQPDCLAIPVECITTAKVAYERLKNMLQECSNVLGGPAGEHDLSFSTMKDVAKVITEAKNAEAFVATITKARSRIAASSS